MAWGKGPTDSAKNDFVALCKKIATSTTPSTSLTLLHSKYISIWTKENIELFCQALQTNTNLEELHCTGFDFQVNGCVLLSKALQINKTLKRLTFGHHATFNDEQLQAFVENTPLYLQEVDFERKNLTKSSAVALGKAFAHPNHSGAKWLVSNNAFENEGFASLCEHINGKPITVLAAAQISISQLPATFASKFPNLQSLNLSDNAIGAAGMLVLATLDCNELILNSCDIGDEGCVALVSGGKPRARLSLSRNNLTSHGVSTLCEALLLPANRKLEYLNLSHNTLLGNEGLERVAQVLAQHNDAASGGTTRLQIKLDASYCNATAMPHEFLLHLDSLEFGGNGPMLVHELVQVVEVTKHKLRVNTLGLTGTGLTDIARLFEALHFKTELAVLECGGIPMTAEDRQALNKLNEINPHLDVAVDKGEDGAQE